MMMVKRRLYNKVRSKAQLCFLLFMGGALLVGCKEKKEQPDEIVVDKVMDKLVTLIEVFQETKTTKKKK